MMDPSPADCAAALDVLLSGIPVEQRVHAAGFLLQEIERLYAAAGALRPPAIDALRTGR